MIATVGKLPPNPCIRMTLGCVDELALKKNNQFNYNDQPIKKQQR